MVPFKEKVIKAGSESQSQLIGVLLFRNAIFFSISLGQSQVNRSELQPFTSPFGGMQFLATALPDTQQSHV
jgi:uncharacterized membrane protein YgdD (TMEM256/DUF423 family)